MLTVTLFTRSNCLACSQAEADLDGLQSVIPHQLVIIDLDRTPGLLEQFGERAPVIEVGPYRLYSPFTRQDIQAALGAAQDRTKHLSTVNDTTYRARIQRGHSLTGADRATYWLSNHYTFLFNAILLLYVGLPFLAPIFMEIGFTPPARVIYSIYHPLCHQLAYRSWFLFGEQPAYPRELAQVSGLATFEQTTGIDPLDLKKSEAFIGNQNLGYKVAFCERDVAIYGGFLLFGLLFAITGRKMRAMPWYLWILIGIIPIAVDGFSQLPSLLESRWAWLSWLPIRESTPFLRTITGLLFGISTAWFGYPYAEESMRETRLIMARKIAVTEHESAQPKV